MLTFSINNLVNGGKLNISLKKDGETNKLDFSVNSESLGIYGNLQEMKRIELAEKAQLLDIVDKLDVKTPEIVSAILNGDKVTPQMISEARTIDVLSVEPENCVDKLIESKDEPRPTE